ncbi:MAG: tRNA (adenosine(37)-N6)-threonylcarbamoyltransferase complex dimerization subunit type 1 TsaB, partial [Candidatus Omnitrophota bacterium]
AISENGKILDSFKDSGDLKHSDLLIPTMDKLFKNLSMRLKDIDIIALSVGPGSFTGLRIGVAACKAINLALGIPIVSVPTLDVIAYNFMSEKEDQLCPIIDAKKQKVYSAIYEKPKFKRTTGYMLKNIEDIVRMIRRPTAVFGDGAELYKEELKKNTFMRIANRPWQPQVEALSKIGYEKALKKEYANPDKLVPMYLHSQYCQIAPHLRAGSIAKI